jgi:hypothetical protein
MTGCTKSNPADKGGADPGGAVPGEQGFTIDWTGTPGVNSKALMGAWGTDPKTGEYRFYSPEELRRMTK